MDTYYVAPLLPLPFASKNDASSSSCRPIVGGYELGGILGIGTYGEVRHAVHIKSGRQVPASFQS